MRTFYPPLKTNETYEIKVQEPHVLHVEECGDPNGIPVVVIHGGPGGGCDSQMRCFFDPEVYRIILFDQRGCGQSTPHAELQDNNTAALLEDMEVIREKLNVDKWVVFGGSWGSTLGLVYAQAFPERVMAMILRGIFLGREEDIQWFYQHGTRHMFPDHWHEFASVVPANDQDDIVKGYYNLLTSNDELHRMAAAKAWAKWEAQCATLDPNPKLVDKYNEASFALSFSRIECHYFINNCFLKPNQILNHMERIQHIPGILIHGRYDMVCPLENAWLLHRAWENSTLNIIRDAGHAATEPGILDELIYATQEVAKIFST